MPVPEFREYSIQGELPPEQWERFLQFTGSLGLSSNIRLTYDELPPEQYDPATLSELQDLHAFADRPDNDFSKRTAGRAWNRLIILQLEKTSPPTRQLAHIQSTLHIPDLFVSMQQIEEGTEQWRASGLKLEALSCLNERATEIIKNSPKYLGITRAFGRDFGPRGVAFLAAYEQHMRQQ